MGLSSRQSVHARHRHGADCRHDPRKAAPWRRHGCTGLPARLIALWLLLAGAAAADTIRIATWNAELTRQGPGLLLRDIAGGQDAQVLAATALLAALDADVLLLTGVDYDHGLVALAALDAELGGRYPHRFALRPNTGMATGFDLDGDGRRGGPRDAQGYGRFAGEGGMAVLSRLPILADRARDFSAFLWRDLPDAMLPPMAAEVLAVQRLPTTAHWEVPLALPGGQTLRLLAWHATPPTFDGPEDRNGRRNHDEAAFWLRLLNGQLPMPPPESPFVLLGDANIDPADGEGRREAMLALLAHPALQDPAPRSRSGRSERGHVGDPALDTADFSARDGPGGLRVDVVLPGAGLRVVASGVLWPPPGDPLAPVAAAASRHRPVWVDLELP